MRHGQRYVARLGKVLEFARIFLPSNEALQIAAAVHINSCNVFDWNKTRANIFKHNGDRLLCMGRKVNTIVDRLGGELGQKGK